MRMRKLICMVLGILCVFCIVLLPQTGSAVSSHPENFLSYTPSGDPITDMIRVAGAQYKRTKAQIGYTEDWCSEFLGDCAIITGQTETIPFYPYSGDLYNYLINDGGDVVSSPQPGDIVFYFSGTYSAHVGLMEDYSKCISGNMGSNGGKVESYPYDQICAGLPNRSVKIVRPKYRYVLDVNFRINGQDTLDLSGIGGSFTINVGGTVHSGLTDFARRVKSGTDYTISDIRAGNGYAFTGATEGPLSGTLKTSNISIRLNFASAYTVQYNANGGSGAPASQTKIHGQDLTLSSVKPTKSGCTFMGWAASAGASEAVYQAGGTYTADRDATLYAVWKVNEYDISYHLNGGTGSIPKQHVTGKTASLTTVKPTRAHYDFLGWSKSKTASVAAYLPGGSYTGTGNVTLYAVWQRRIDKVSKLPSGLTGISSEAFLGTDFDAILVPKTVTAIGSDAFGDTVIYCYSGSAAETYAKNNGLLYKVITADWVHDNEVPQGARITSEKWTYDVSSGRETTTSTNPSLEGWTQESFIWQKTGSTGTMYYAAFPSGFKTDDPAYLQYNHAQYETTVTGNTKREYALPSFWQYCYWHWCWVDSLGADDRNVTVQSYSGYNSSEGRDYIYFDKILTTLDMSKEGMSLSGLRSFDNLWSTYHHPEYNLAEYASWWWYRFEMYKQGYTDYEKLFTYVRETIRTYESSTEPSGDGIKNVQHWVKYSF